MVISIVGNIKSTEKTINQVKKILNHQTNTFKSKITFPTIKPSKKKRFIYHDKPEQETIYLIWIIQKYGSTKRLDKISRHVFNCIIGNSVDSILFKIFRLKYGLVYGIKSYLNNSRNYSTFEISCQIDPTNHQKFFKVFDSEFQNIINDITLEKFEQTIKYTNYQSLMAYDSVREISNTITNEVIKYKTIFLPEDYINLSKKINYQKTMDFLKTKLTKDNQYTFIMTPTKPEHK